MYRLHFIYMSSISRLILCEVQNMQAKSINGSGSKDGVLRFRNIFLLF